MDGHDHVVVGTLDALRESVAGLDNFLRRRSTSRGGVTTAVAALLRRQELLPANNFRHMATIFNDSTAILYVALGSNASLDTWTVRLQAGDYYEVPPGYTGPVTAVWDAANGQARITELV